MWAYLTLYGRYCDGLRGPLVVYDPADPFLDMYDVDDGKQPLSLTLKEHTLIVFC
jgi:hypothetical protein